MPYANAEDAVAWRKKYYQQNKERIDARNRKWLEQNRDKHRGYRRKSYTAHRESEIVGTRQYYLNNKQAMDKYRLDRKRKNKLLWVEIITGMGMNRCSVCGYDKCFAAIDFHHKDPSQKVTDVNRLFYEKPTKVRLAELDKCIAICSNCHRELHFGKESE